jgi:hypothetical protein
VLKLPETDKTGHNVYNVVYIRRIVKAESMASAPQVLINAVTGEVWNLARSSVSG